MMQGIRLLENLPPLEGFDVTTEQRDKLAEALAADEMFKNQLIKLPTTKIGSIGRRVAAGNLIWVIEQFADDLEINLHG